MKLKKYISILLALALAAAVLSGCGASSKGSYDSAAAEEAAPMEAPAAAAGENGALTGAAADGSAAAPENRKWIITVHLSAETEDLDSMTAALDAEIRSLGGYVEDQNVYNGSAYSARRYRSANLTVRIPADKVDQFTQQVGGISNIVSQEKSMEDITLRYVDTQSRVTALKTEEARLLELLAKAETMADLLEIEARLTDVRYELERHSSQLRVYDNQVDYATIYLNISEVQEYTPVEDPTLWERIRKGFAGSLEDLGESLQDLLVWIIVAAPFLLVYGGGLYLGWRLVRRIRKRAASREKTKSWQLPGRKNEEPKSEE